jgi:HK97 family phage major capsid protein
MFEERLKEINERKLEIRSILKSDKDVNLSDMEAELSKLDDEVKAIEKRSEIANSIQANSIEAREVKKPAKVEFTAENVLASKEYRSAYFKDLMGKELTDVEQRAMTTASNSVGAVIPTTTMNEIVAKLEQAGVILPLVRTLNIPSNVKLPVEDTINDVAWVSEGGSNDKNDKISYVELKANQLIKTFEITALVEEMSIDAFEEFIVAQLVRKVKVAIDNGIINGTGSNNEPHGIMSVITPIESESATAYTYDDLMTILAELKSGYKQNATFVLSTKTLYNEIAKIKDDENNPIFKPETDGRFEGKLCGYPVVTYDNLADGTVIFGDFDYYYFNFVKDFAVDKDDSIGFKTGNRCYRVMAIADGNVALEEAFVVMGKKQ